MTDFEKILRQLHENGVEFILIGGVAARALGSSRLTDDIDIVYRRTLDNMRRLVDALAPYHPYLRGAPAGLPFQWDVDTLKRGLNFTLTTRLGSIDLLGEVAGGGTYEQLLPFTAIVEISGIPCRCVNLTKLIELKRAAGRPKDLEAIAELEVLRELYEEQGLSESGEQ
ncbi:MAG: nucleotidyltransferase [Fimbriimonadales bacterium]|nr:nucleotidyltransferase [Fimbriimonadales bacterium]